MLATEAVVQSVPRHQWIEFLDDLHIDGEVKVSHGELRDPTSEGWKIRSADFDPFEHLIEIVLENHHVSVRVLLEDPRSLSFEGSERAPRRLRIRTAEGSFEMAARSDDGNTTP